MSITNKLSPGSIACRVLFAPLLVTSFLLSACGGGGGGSGGAAVQPRETETTLEGVWQFEKVPATLNGLDYSKIELKAIRNAVVELIAVADGKVVQTSTTSATGAYSFKHKGTGKFKVRVQAKTSNPSNILVEDNTQQDALWVTDSPEIEVTDTGVAAATLTKSFIAKSGWGGSAYTTARASAPFNLLDRCQLASEMVLGARPDLKLPDLKVNWSPNNRIVANAAENVAIGIINGSSYDPNTQELFIMGQADVDTDEFDDHTIVHEWGHFFESNVTRSDSLGGSHSTGDVLDPPIAFGEGFGYAIAAVVLAPNTLNVDSSGKGQKDGGGSYDLENNDIGDPNPGFFSERSVQFIFYDLFDSNNEAPFDTVGLGLKPILDVLTGPQKNADSRTTIFSFLSAIKTQNPASAAGVDLLAQKHLIAAVQDEWGTGETNAFGVVGALPVYPQLANPMTVKLNGTLYANGEGDNKLPAVRTIRYTPTTSGVRTFAATTTGAGQDIRIFLIHRGQILGGADDLQSEGTETFQQAVEAGKTYVLLIQDQSTFAAYYDVTLTTN